MERSMLDEYKTLNRFWAEVVNTVCDATNHLYLHKLLKKTFYELLTVTSQVYLTFEFLEASAICSKGVKVF
jgi:hypothetical protein